MKLSLGTARAVAKHRITHLAVTGAATATVAVLSLGNTPTPPVQKIYVVNASTTVTNTEVSNAMPAFQAAVNKDFKPVWNIGAKLIFLGRKKAPSGTEVITLRDKSDQAGALAYHELTDGQPCSEIFVGTSKVYGYNWTVGFTHELWEQLADPSLINAMQSPDGRIWANEIADPVEDDSLGYSRAGRNGAPVVISDFITPKWYGALTAGPFDFMNHVQAPLVVLKGGYAQWWDGFTWHLIQNYRRAHIPRW